MSALRESLPVFAVLTDVRRIRAGIVLCVALLLATPSSAQEPQEAAPQDTRSESPSVQTDPPAEGADASAAAEDGAEKPESQDPPPPPPLILRTYQVQIGVAFVNSPTFPEPVRRRIVLQTSELLQSRFQQMWSVSIAQFDESPAATIRGLGEMTDEMASALGFPGDVDKVFQLVVDERGGAYRLACREWDAATRTLGPLHSHLLADRRELSAELARLVGESFRPLAELETLDENRIEFLIRAGEFPPRDPELAAFAPGDYLVPFMRYLDRKREVRQIQPIPWTYLQVEDVTRSRMTVSLTSAFGAPIPSSRRRIEVVALRVRPHLPSTDVRVTPRGNPRNPLVGYRCEALPRLPTDEDPVEDRLKLSTDRRGIATLPADPDHPLVFLHIYSGSALLARVPMIPGVLPEMDMEVPDDRARLTVEGEVALLQSELIDIVATREVVMARCRGAAEKGKWDDVDRFLKDLGKLPTLERFLGRIETLQVQAVYAAQQNRDRVAESRIKRLCSDIRESAQKHLDPFRLTEFRREMNVIRPK